MRVLAIVFFFILPFLTPTAVGAQPNETAALRVGIIVLRNRPIDVAGYDSFFLQLSSRLTPPRAFSVAVGTQADIVGWVGRGLIDIAVVDSNTMAAIGDRFVRGDFPNWSSLAIDRHPQSPEEQEAGPIFVITPAALPERADFQRALLALAPDRFVSGPEESRPISLETNGIPDPPRGGSVDRLAQSLTLDLLASMLLQYRCVNETPIRLAVVFSGGGAKCSYQAGAIRAVEEKLAELRAKYADPSFDISLVVGTSGGAINAVPVAMGLAQSPAGQEDYLAAWKDLDQRELIRPSTLNRLIMILWFVCVQGVLLLRIRRVRHFKNPERHPWIISRHIISIGVLEVLLARLPWKPWSTLGTSSTVHHLWLWLTWGLEGSGWLLISLGIISAALRKVPKVQLIPFQAKFRVVRRIFWVGIILSPLIQGYIILFHQPTLSDSVGLERVLTRNFQKLINGQLMRDGKESIEVSDQKDSAEALRSFSRSVIARRVVKRDLVLTGSALPRVTTEAAGDLYFYIPGSESSPEPRFGSRGVALQSRPALFMDALLASGAIYPVFPARTLVDVPRPGDVSEVVDGSFEHRSPIEAAVLWGATHIILIQAATDEIVPRGALLDNINAAVNHLYDQAQLLDFRSREHVPTFSLTPRPPQIGLLDFADNLLAASAAKGYAEANGTIGLTSRPVPTWRKEFGEPDFWTPTKRGHSPVCEKSEL